MPRGNDAYREVYNGTLGKCVATFHAAALAVLDSGIDSLCSIATAAIVGAIIENIAEEFVVASRGWLLIIDSCQHG